MILSWCKQGSWYHVHVCPAKFHTSTLYGKKKGKIQEKRQNICGITCLAGDISITDVFKYQRTDVEREVFNCLCLRLEGFRGQTNAKNSSVVHWNSLLC